jgi:hypothetical protein
MKRTVTAAIVLVFLAGSGLIAGGQGKGKKHADTRNDANGRVDVHVAFGSTDLVVLREHYAPRYRNLPPGLQKKVARGGQLPPGWQKKFEPFPIEVERRLTPLPSVYRRGVIDGHAVIFDPRTNVIVDLAVLF